MTMAGVCIFSKSYRTDVPGAIREICKSASQFVVPAKNPDSRRNFSLKWAIVSLQSIYVNMAFIKSNQLLVSFS